MMPLVAALPIVALMISMTVFGWAATRAGLAASVLALILAATHFELEIGAITIAGLFFEAGFTTATILWIIFPALVLHELQTRSGASERIGVWLSSISGNPAVLVLLLAWFFAVLLEGAAGFGTPVALVAPLLVSFGFSPSRALVLALIGHSVGVSFGAVGTPMIPLLAQFTGDSRMVATTTMLLHAVLGCGLAMAVYKHAAIEHTMTNWVTAPLAGLLFLLPALGLAWLSGPEIPTLGGALIGGALFSMVARKCWPPDRLMRPMPLVETLGAFLPNALVVVIILVTRSIPELAMALQSFELDWQLAGRFSGSVQLFYHPGTMLMLALAATLLASNSRRQVMVVSLHAAARRIPSVALALVAVLFLSRAMLQSSMIETLAIACAMAFGNIWPLAIPLVGALGSFVTGSATASNILFAEFHLTAAEASGIAPTIVLSGQAFGAAIGNVVTPHNIVAGAATVGLVGREGDVLKTTLPICLAYAVSGGLLLLVMVSVNFGR